MSRRQINQFSAFEFQADFSAPKTVSQSTNPPTPTEADETVTLPVMEIAALGAKLQADAAEAARGPVDAALVERLEQATDQLSAALAHLTELSVALDLAARMGQIPPSLAPIADQAAKSLADGQGDLFAACKALTSKAGR
ncbi:MAG: hypothetical protein AAF829_03095 [Pseudomonadota bacterium]